MMELAGIWRYPIKSTRGESLSAEWLTPDGVSGDRTVQVFNGRGRLVTSRTHPALLAHQGAIGASDEPTVDGHPWTTPEAQSVLEAAIGAGAHFRRDDTASQHPTGGGRRSGTSALARIRDSAIPWRNASVASSKAQWDSLVLTSGRPWRFVCHEAG